MTNIIYTLPLHQIELSSKMEPKLNLNPTPHAIESYIPCSRTSAPQTPAQMTWKHHGLQVILLLNQQSETQQHSTQMHIDIARL